MGWCPRSSPARRGRGESRRMRPTAGAAGRHPARHGGGKLRLKAEQVRRLFARSTLLRSSGISLGRSSVPKAQCKNCTLNAVGLLSLDVETRGSPGPRPTTSCVSRSLPYLTSPHPQARTSLGGAVRPSQERGAREVALSYVQSQRAGRPFAPAPPAEAGAPPRGVAAPGAPRADVPRPSSCEQRLFTPLAVNSVHRSRGSTTRSLRTTAPLSARGRRSASFLSEARVSFVLQ